MLYDNTLENDLPHWNSLVYCNNDFFCSNKFPMSLNGGGSETKASDDCWFITGGAGITGWSSSSSLLT